MQLSLLSQVRSESDFRKSLKNGGQRKTAIFVNPRPRLRRREMRNWNSRDRPIHRKILENNG